MYNNQISIQRLNFGRMSKLSYSHPWQLAVEIAKNIYSEKEPDINLNDISASVFKELLSMILILIHIYLMHTYLKISRLPLTFKVTQIIIL